MGHAVVLAIDMYRDMYMLEHVHVNVEGERTRELKNLQMLCLYYGVRVASQNARNTSQSAISSRAIDSVDRTKLNKMHSTYSYFYMYAYYAVHEYKARGMLSVVCSLGPYCLL